MPNKLLRCTVLTLVTALGTAMEAQAETKTIARCGAGFLESQDGYRVLHLKGTPYEMGYQQGALLRDDIRENVRYLFDVKGKEMKVELAGVKLLDPKRVISGIVAQQKKHVPERFFEEMRGIADGAGIDVQDVIVANFIPELFHCSGFAVSGSATKDGTLYHGRILDYGCDWKLQEHAVLTVAEPEGKIPFVNVTYAGFVGSVTGMNAEKISIGEMGGQGLGHWDGVPMAFLMRMVLEEAMSLDQAIAIFHDHPRTCEYYFVVADGNTGKGAGMEASWDTFSVVAMGESHPKLPEAVKDAVVLSAGDRYKELVRRVKAAHGTLDAASALHLMDRPVAMKSNLHSVLFETTSGRLWVANASKEGKPAAEQPYHAFDFPALRKHQADASAPSLTAPPSAPGRAASIPGTTTAVALARPTAAEPVQSTKIDLRTRAGVDAVKGEWRYHDVKIIEVDGKSKDGSTNRTYSYEPKAKGPDFDDSGWDVIKPETLRNARGNGQICFCWYRIKVTIPPEAEGKAVFFQTTVDDYGEVWVDGKLPRKPGDTGGPIAAGFNVPNRLELKDARPGKVFQIAIFGINGPISDTPTNWIFLGPTFLELVEKQ